MEHTNMVKTPNTVIPSGKDTLQSPELPDKLQKILSAMIEYHKNFLHKNTLNSQNPNKLEEIRKYFKEVCCQICDYIENSDNKPTLLQDSDFQKLFQVIQQETNDWDSEISVLIPYWCNLMFVQYPFSISQNHIWQLYKNSKSTSDDI